MRRLVDQLSGLRRFDLAQSWRVGMPHHPTHPLYTHSLTKLHGDFVRANGASSAGDAIALGTHTGTHIDALCHYSRDGKMHGGTEVAGLQDWSSGIARHGAETMGLMLRRGILLDVARLADRAATDRDSPLDAETGIDAELLARAEEAAGARLEAGDVALIRSGWGRYWNESRRFINGMKLPGVTLDGARWLSGRGVCAAGSDTASFEQMPSSLMEVHVHLLVECGIHIMECLQLEELSAAGVGEFLFVAAALKLEGATGAPLRPYALAEVDRGSDRV
jgi:kynurenine formamidase